MNKVCLIGRLVRDIELRRTQDISVASFTLAVDRQVKDAPTDFIRCVAFGKTAEFLDDYFEKGIRLGVTGRIQTGSYKNKDGDTVYTTDIIVESVDFADGKREDPDDDRKGRKDDKRSGRR